MIVTKTLYSQSCLTSLLIKKPVMEIKIEFLELMKETKVFLFNLLFSAPFGTWQTCGAFA